MRVPNQMRNFSRSHARRGCIFTRFPREKRLHRGNRWRNLERACCCTKMLHKNAHYVIHELNAWLSIRRWSTSCDISGIPATVSSCQTVGIKCRGCWSKQRSMIQRLFMYRRLDWSRSRKKIPPLPIVGYSVFQRTNEAAFSAHSCLRCLNECCNFVVIVLGSFCAIPNCAANVHAFISLTDV